MKKLEKILIFVLSFCVIVKFFSGFSLDNYHFPGGTDTCFHLFRVWYASYMGLPNWNYYWYGGFVFLKYYPPVSMLIASSFSKLVGYLLAYKFMNNLFVAIAPIVFFVFLKDFKLPTEKIIVALIFFSFIPIYAHYLADGRYSTIVSLVFALSYWLFLKRTIDKGTVKNILITSLLLALCLLTHHTTMLLFIPVSFLWAIIYSTNKKTIYKFLTIAVISLLLASWWVLPFFLDTFSLEKNSSYSTMIEKSNPVKLTDYLFFTIFNIRYYSLDFGPEIVTISLAIGGIFCLLSLFDFKNKITRNFIIVTILMVVILLVVRYKRILVFLPIPLSVLFAQGVFTIKNNIRKIVVPIFFLLLITGYLSIRPQNYAPPEFPVIPKDGRVMFLPFETEFDETAKDVKFRYSVLLSPMYGNENIEGWYETAQRVGKASNQKILYDDMIMNPTKFNQKDYYNLLKGGWVNYIAVNKKSQEDVNYFNESKYFKLINESKLFYVYEIAPTTSYVEMNKEKITDINITKGADEISINFVCKTGNITVKESYHEDWNGVINGKPIDIEPSEYGFMEIKNNESGLCDIKLTFKNPNYYVVFDLISISTFILITIYLINDTIIKKFKKLKMITTS